MSSIKSNIKIENNSIIFGNNYIKFPSGIKAKEILLLHANGAISSVQLDTEKQIYISYDFSKLNLSKIDFISMLHSQSVERQNYQQIYKRLSLLSKYIMEKDYENLSIKVSDYEKERKRNNQTS